MMKEDNKPIEIIPNLYLGSIGSALSKETLTQFNIKFILSALDNIKEAFPNLFTYKFIKLLDSND